VGFSVSASAAIVFVGFVVAFTTLYPVAANGFERVSDARDAAGDRALDRENTDIDHLNATWSNTTETLTVNLTNTGTTALSVEHTDLLVDNTHWTGDRSVEDDADTEVWLPGERLTITVQNVTIRPDRVKVVSDHGVSLGTDQVGGSA
jgi:flagellar protein FlaF